MSTTNWYFHFSEITAISVGPTQCDVKASLVIILTFVYIKQAFIFHKIISAKADIKFWTIVHTVNELSLKGTPRIALNYYSSMIQIVLLHSLS